MTVPSYLLALIILLLVITFSVVMFTAGKVGGIMAVIMILLSLGGIWIMRTQQKPF